MKEIIMTTTTKRNNEQDRQIANTINQQIGGKSFYMLGAKNKAFGVNEKGQVYLGFGIRGSKKANYIKVIYNEGMDEYIMEFGKIRKFEYKVVNTVEGVYCDQLNEIIEENTGLYTRL